MAWSLIEDYALLVIMPLFAAAIIAAFYHFPFCEKCRDNRRTKRIKGKKILRNSRQTLGGDMKCALVVISGILLAYAIGIGLPLFLWWREPVPPKS